MATALDMFNIELQAQADEMTSQLNDFIYDLIPKVNGGSPITTDGYMISFNFGSAQAKKIAKAKIMVSVVMSKPGRNVLQVLTNKQMPALVKNIKLGPVTYVFREVPVYGASKQFKQIGINPATGKFDETATKPLIQAVIGELLDIYVDFNKHLEG